MKHMQRISCVGIGAFFLLATVALMCVFSGPGIRTILAVEADKAETAKNESKADLVIAEAEADILRQGAKALESDRRAAHPLEWLAEMALTLALAVGLFSLTLVIVFGVVLHKAPGLVQVLARKDGGGGNDLDLPGPSRTG